MTDSNRVALDSDLKSRMLKAYLDVLNEYDALGLLKEDIGNRLLDADNDLRARLYIRLDRIQIRMESIRETLSPIMGDDNAEWLK